MDWICNGIGMGTPLCCLCRVYVLQSLSSRVQAPPVVPPSVLYIFKTQEEIGCSIYNLMISSSIQLIAYVKRKQVPHINDMSCMVVPGV